MNTALKHVCGKPAKLSIEACIEKKCKSKLENVNYHSEQLCGQSEKIPNDGFNEETCNAKLENGNHYAKQLTKSQREAHEYLERNKISELFNFLMGHLLADEPLEPIEYLSDLLDKCILFRFGLREPPLLFTSRHIRSIYRSLDPTGTGSISFNQFKTGMTALGISFCETYPNECNRGRVSQETFETEAKTCLEKMLKEMVGNPKE